jgi:hypothetical protein
MTIYKGYGVRFTPSGGTAKLIGGITAQSLMLGSQVQAQETAGAKYAQSGNIVSMKPRGMFTSHSVGALAVALGLNGACLAGGSSPGLEMWELSYERCGSITASGTPHRKLIVPNGIVIPRSIECSHQQDATMSAEVIAAYDGTNDPVIISGGQSAPTGLTDAFRFTLGPISVAGIDITNVMNMSIDFGNNAKTDGGDSELFDSHIEVTQILPTITIRTKDVTKFAASGAIPLRGSRATHADTSIVLRRRVNGTGTFSTSDDNIEITADGIVNWEDVWNAQANGRGEATIKITCMDDGTNAPLVIVDDFEPA